MSISSFVRTAAAFLRKTGLPVYFSGQIPESAAFPYITLNGSAPAFGDAAQWTVTAWYRDNRGHAKRLDMADSLRELFPSQGVRLRFPGGAAMLYPSSGSCVTLVSDTNDPYVLGVRLRLTARLYTP